jgi:thiopurine S-methyltransferase
MTENASDYWSKRYKEDNTPWDIGYPSTPLIAYLQNLTYKNIRILVPGAGNAYEAEWLWKNGFRNVHVIDIAQAPLDSLAHRVIDFPENQLIHNDFFELNDTFDLIIEQTFFCALNPNQREDYVKKMASLLGPGGHLVGVMFDFELTSQGPPFGGSQKEYESLFTPYFKIAKLDRCYNSIKPRQGNELFVHLIK